MMRAAAGHVLTNGEAYGTTIVLSPLDREGNWHEITEEEYLKRIEEVEVPGE